MGFLDKTRKKAQELQARIESQRLQSLQGQRKRSEAAADRSLLRQRELKRIASARKTSAAEGKLREKSRGKRKDVDFGSIFFDAPKKKAPVKRVKRRKVKKGNSTKGKTITIRLD